jgi:hypothetical protein
MPIILPIATIAVLVVVVSLAGARLAFGLIDRLFD